MDKIKKREVLNFFRGKRIFITGHTGFKGSWLAYLLVNLGAEVMGYALPPITEENHFDLLDLSDDLEHVVGDIRDYGLMESKIKTFKPEIVFHLAAQALVYQSSNARVDVPSSPMAKVNGPALKTSGLAVKPISVPDYMIPKKTVPVGVSYSNKSSSKKHKTKKSKRSDRKASSKSGARKAKHSKKSRKSSSKARKYVASSASSVSSVSESEVSENEEQKQV